MTTSTGRWSGAHSIALADPTSWPSGGELLVTTGLRRSGSVINSGPYVRRLVRAGVAALGFGTGLTHPRVPPALTEAAAEHDLPLLEVPLPKLFVAGRGSLPWRVWAALPGPWNDSAGVMDVAFAQLDDHQRSLLIQRYFHLSRGVEHVAADMKRDLLPQDRLALATILQQVSVLMLKDE
ncbi:PucR family transcriptional regulator ligand-binding domain-containing protein [Streptomyces sp. NBC_01320]|uniref:PucR family transcriptional regulator ligand-binding domain-containing protein n=1 Tax=Streptomyces sp. NBC_01320 TaxID=2903824 RepID=UPI002E1478C7|nr:PucR family transcriptional regulator ligand-binding domain-containing protein [Streptomyces sp. NBC_01320]